MPSQRAIIAGGCSRLAEEWIDEDVPVLRQGEPGRRRRLRAVRALPVPVMIQTPTKNSWVVGVVVAGVVLVITALLFLLAAPGG